METEGKDDAEEALMEDGPGRGPAACGGRSPMDQAREDNQNKGERG